MATSAHPVEGGIEGTDWEVFTPDPAISRRVGALLNIGVREVAPPLQPPGAAVRHRNLEVLEMFGNQNRRAARLAVYATATVQMDPLTDPQPAEHCSARRTPWNAFAKTA